MKKNKNENLIQHQNRPADEIKANAKKAGIASGKARRQRKAVRQCLNDVLSSQAKDNIHAAEIAKRCGLDSDADVQTVLVTACILNSFKRATIKDIETLAAILGETAITAKEERQQDNLNRLIDAMKVL